MMVRSWGEIWRDMEDGQECDGWNQENRSVYRSNSWLPTGVEEPNSQWNSSSHCTVGRQAGRGDGLLWTRGVSWMWAVLRGWVEGLQPVVICFNMYLHKLSHIVISPRLVTYERKLDSKVPTEVTLSVGHKLSFEDNVVILLYIQYTPNVSLISALSNCPRAEHCKTILKAVCFPPIRNKTMLLYWDIRAICFLVFDS